MQDFTLLARVSGTTVQMAAVRFVGRTRPCTVLYLCLASLSKCAQAAGRFLSHFNFKVLLHYEFHSHYQEKLCLVSANMSNSLSISAVVFLSLICAHVVNMCCQGM